MTDIVFCWPVSSFYGWGVRGLGYALAWPGVAISADPSFDAELPPGDSRQQRLADVRRLSSDFQRQLMNDPSSEIHLDMPVLVPMGNDLSHHSAPPGKFLFGKPTVACPVFEDVAMVSQHVHKLRNYDLVVVASRWNQEVLAGLGIKSELVHEGIDPQIFHPTATEESNEAESDGGTGNAPPERRFRVFSGGKPEYRKGHDLVIEAFVEFAKVHPNSTLVAAWQSPFPWHARDLAQTSVGAPPGLHLNKPNYHAWVQRAGIKPEQFELVARLPNWRMAEVYRSCDVAIFPNRKEGGTNFVAMECMASGVPTAIRPVYGQKDLPLDSIEWLLPEDDKGALVTLGPFLSARCGRRMHSLTFMGWTWERHCRQLAELIGG